jgi:hypothetical protein
MVALVSRGKAFDKNLQEGDLLWHTVWLLEVANLPGFGELMVIQCNTIFFVS